MFSRINFTYKKPAQDSQSYLILREQLVKQKIKENEKKSLINCISSQNKIDSKKVQNTSDTFEQSREKIDYHDSNNIIEIKLSDSSTINNGIIDNVTQPEIILLTDKQNHEREENIKSSQISLHNKVDPNKIQNTRDTFEQSKEKIDHYSFNTIIEMKLSDSVSINNGIIDNVTQPEIILLTDKQNHEREENIKISQTSLHNKVDPNKIQNTRDTFEQSKEKIDHYLFNNTIIEMKLSDSVIINNGIIDNVKQPENILLTDKQHNEREENIKISQTSLCNKITQISLYNKLDPNKIQNTRDTIEQSNEKIHHYPLNSISIEMKLSDSVSINNGIIDNVKQPENILLTDKQHHEREENIKISQTSLYNKVDPNKIQNTRDTIEQSKEKVDQSKEIIHHYPFNTIIEMKLSDYASINTGIIDDANKPEILLTHEQIRVLQAIKDKYINDLSEPVEDGNFDLDAVFAFIENVYEDHSEMDDNIPLPFNVGRIHKRGIKIINHVYQSKYDNGKINSSGLGDFLRGCYFILQFCETYNFQPKIVFNNCISKFLLIKTHNLERFDNILEGISGYRNNNFSEFVIENGIIKDPIKDNKNIMADFVDYVVKLPQYSGNVFMYCISFPINEISEKNKEHMRKFLEPTNEMKIIINQTLDDLNITSKQYIVIHIRSGDSYLKEENDTFTNGYIRDLITNIKKDINSENNYLLIADSNDVKKIIQKYFPNFKTLMNPITHFGEGVILEEEKVKNTLIDFYLLSQSKSIFSYSAYQHGSGFSYWCAKTFNIPYVCKYVK
jgi:hypothetical protein